MTEQLTPAQLVEVARAERRRRWEQGDRVPAEEFLRRYPALQGQPAYALELVYHEKLLRSELGEQPALSEYLRRFPQFSMQLRALFEVDSWLQESPAAASGLAGTDSALSVTPVEPEGQLPPLPSIPGYEILGRLGRGGVGVVYLARQERLGRLVALKMLLAAAHADAQQVARFRAEAEAQARVQHPNIVQIFEVGEHDGWPYLALEYLEGGRLADRLQGTPQPVQWSAELVEALARAVQHAHERGLVHRDLKPANILLTADGTPKISDFGLAKRVQEGGANPTVSGDIVGTPAYMAPEQATGESHRVGPAADIYALGAILYELLTGRPPFLAATALETLLQVRQQEPVPPRRWLPSVPRDLETIILKCLRKEPDKRYPSAEALADDLKRFRLGAPIVARPVGVVERGLKWARRRPAAAALVGVLLLLLVGGPVGGVWYAARERERADQENKLRQKAERSEEDARAVLDFFQNHVLAAARPENQDGGLGVNASLRDALNAAEPRIALAFHERPLVEASIRHVLAHTYACLRENQAAIRQLGRAVQLRQQELGPDHLDTLQSRIALAGAYRADAQFDKAVLLYQEVLATCQEQVGTDHPDMLACLNGLAVAYQGAGQLDKAVPLLEQTLAKRNDVLGPDHPDTLISMGNLAGAYQAAGQVKKALPLFEQELAKERQNPGSNHPDTLITMNNLAMAYYDAGQRDKALVLLEQTLAKRQQILGPDHPHTLSSMANLAHTYQAAGQVGKAIPLLKLALAQQREKLGSDHPGTLSCANNLAMAYRAAFQFDKALPLLEQTLDKRRQTLGSDHPDTLLSMNNLALLYREVGQVAKAVPLYEDALAKQREKLGTDHPLTLVTMNNLAAAYNQTGRSAEALALRQRTLAMLQKKPGPDHPDTLTSMNNLAFAYLEAGQLDKALPMLEQALEKRQKAIGSDHPDTLISMDNLAHAYQKNGDFGKAEDVLRRCLNLRQQKGPDHWPTFHTQSKLGQALASQQRFAEAEPLLLAGYEGLEAWGKTVRPAKIRVPAAVERLVQCYDAWGKPEQAAIWRQKLEQAKPPTPSPTK